jgi:hypothetical protein
METPAGEESQVDFDLVEPTNVTTQGFLHCDCGVPKVEAVAAHVRAMGPDIEIITTILDVASWQELHHRSGPHLWANSSIRVSNLVFSQSGRYAFKIGIPTFLLPPSAFATLAFDQKLLRFLRAFVAFPCMSSKLIDRLRETAAAVRIWRNRAQSPEPTRLKPR